MSLIPFASQRGGGQDLAAHLLNAEDNELVEVLDIRGAMADDLHGAFAEVEAQAAAMTKCQKYLYSLSINPDVAGGPMADELYSDYIERAEDALGLYGQPRAIVRHIKEDKAGNLREHYHVVWSRIDVQDCKAIHMAFDYDKLMGVTRQFARDHGIELALGYYKLEDRKRQSYRQLSLYDKAQENQLGMSKEERMEVVTELWNQRDSASSFVQALEYHGYILARGNRPFVLVDIYGHSNSLPKLIDDRTANTKAIREFLRPEYVMDDEAVRADTDKRKEEFPTVETAQKLAAQHLHALKDREQSRKTHAQLDKLAEVQRLQTEKLEAQRDKKREDHQGEISAQAQHQLDTRRALSGRYVRQAREIREQREAAAPKGLAAFLAKASGFVLMRGQLHKYQDAKARSAFLEEKRELRKEQRAQRLELQRCHEMQMFEQQRQARALSQTQAKELKSLQASLERSHYVMARKGQPHMPAMNLTLGPPDRKAAVIKAKNRHTSSLANEHQKRAEPMPKTGPVDLQYEFRVAAQEQRGKSKSGSGRKPGDADGFKPRDPDRGKGRRR